MDNNKEPKEIKEKQGVQLRSFARFSTIGIQMIVTIVGGYYLGRYIDQYLGYSAPFYQKWIGLLAVFLAMGNVLWQVTKLQK